MKIFLSLLIVLICLNSLNAGDKPNILWITLEDMSPTLGCYGDDYAYFESAHGTAPDIAGQGVINPTATLLSAVMMLEHLGFAEAAERLDSALTRVYAEGRVLTPDQGGSATTTEFCEAVAGLL